MLSENLIRIYQDSFRTNRELPALTDYFKRETFSYFEMAKEIAKLHVLFEACGVERGDRIALIGRNNPRWCIAYLATITYGAVIVPILQDFNANDIHHILNHSGSVLLFAGDTSWDAIDPDNIDPVRGAFSLTDFHCLYALEESGIREFSERLDQHYRERYPQGFTPENISYPDIPNDEMVMISYTSGTTGFTKGVMLSVNNLTGNVTYVRNYQIHGRGSRVLSFLPLAHAYGAAIDFLSSLAVGSHITLLGKIPSPKILIEACGVVKPNVICTVPLVMEKIYRKQVKPMLEKGVVKWLRTLPLLDTKIHDTIREKLVEAFGGNFTHVIIGGASFNEEVEEFLLKIKFPFCVGYGMTECGPLISYTDWKEFVPTSCGRILTGIMEGRIDAPDPETGVGELCVKGENVMLGYYKNEKATAEIIDGQGWLHTGDMGTLSEDGTVFLRGRCKSMILGPNGQNIYPEVIESKLNNLYCVMESLVLERDGKLVALVYPDYEQADADGVGHSQIQAVMDENLKLLNTMVAPFEQVSSIVLYPTEFEKTPKRSIRRYLYNV